jgi:hypothetical protein
METIQLEQPKVINALISKYLESTQKKAFKAYSNSIEKTNNEFKGNISVSLNYRNEKGEITKTETKTINAKEKSAFNMLGDSEKVLNLFAKEDTTFIKGKINQHIKNNVRKFYLNE